MMYRTPCIEFRAIIFEIIENDPWTFKISKRIAQLDIPIPLLPSSLENTRLSLTEGLKKQPKDTCLNRRFSWLNPSLKNITYQSETRQCSWCFILLVRMKKTLIMERGSGAHSSIRCLTDCSSAFTHFSSVWTWMNCFWIKAQLPTTPPKSYKYAVFELQVQLMCFWSAALQDLRLCRSRSSGVSSNKVVHQLNPPQHPTYQSWDRGKCFFRNGTC